MISYQLREEEINDREYLNVLFGSINLADRYVYAPEDRHLIPEGGTWAMITRLLPPIEGGLDKYVSVGSIHWLERDSETDDRGFRRDGRYIAVCNLEKGALKLWPYEYARIEVPAILSMWQGGEMIFHPTNVEPARFNDVVFYCRAKGIPLADAMVMALGTITGSIGWFEPHPDLVPDIESMERRVNRWDPTERRGKNK